MTNLSETFAALVERACAAFWDCPVLNDPEKHSWADHPEDEAKDTFRACMSAALSTSEILRALEAKEKIVGWLRNLNWDSESNSYANAFAENIERDEHLKGTDHADT